MSFVHVFYQVPQYELPIEQRIPGFRKELTPGNSQLARITLHTRYPLLGECVATGDCEVVCLRGGAHLCVAGHPPELLSEGAVAHIPANTPYHWEVQSSASYVRLLFNSLADTKFQVVLPQTQEQTMPVTPNLSDEVMLGCSKD